MEKTQTKKAAERRAGNLFLLLTAFCAIALAVIWQAGGERVPESSAPAASASSPENARLRTPAEVFRELVRAHPSKEVRDIGPMLDDGRVRFATEYTSPVVGKVEARDIMYINGDRVFVATRWFLMSPEVPPCVRLVALRHEAEHLRDDLAGMHFPPLVVFDTSEAEWKVRLSRMLHAEWRADLAQREVERASACEYLETYSMDEGARCRFFKRQMLGNGVHFPQEIFKKYPSLRSFVEQTDCKALSGPF